MNKKETLDLIIKGFGIYLLVLAITQIPKIFGACLMLPYVIGRDMPDESLAVTLQFGVISDSVETFVKFIFYIIVSVNFLRSGSWVKMLMGCERAAEQDNQKE